MPVLNPDLAKAPVVGIAETYRKGLVAEHAHRRAQIMFAASGGATMLTVQGSWVLPPNRALWIPGGMRHSLKVGVSANIRTLYVADKAPGRPLWSTCAVVDVRPLLRELILAAVSLAWRPSMRSASDDRLVRVLLDRMELARQQSVHLPEPTDVRARRFTTHMYANLADRRPLGAIARGLGVSERTLERLMKVETGLSAGAWVQQMRLVFALEMLSAGDRVADVADAVGYQNPSSFIAVFRRAFATTPAKYFSDDERQLDKQLTPTPQRRK